MRTPALMTLCFAVGCSDYDLNRPDDVKDPVVVDTGEEPDLTEPDIQVSPSSLEFGGILKDCSTDAQTITVSNVGEADLIIDEILLDGSGKSAFTLTGSPNATLAPGESLELSVSFTPNAYTTFDAVEVVLRSNDPDEPEADVDLTGSGEQGATVEEIFEQSYFEDVDVLWVLDNSGSMSSALTQVHTNFDAFIQEFITLDLVWNMAVITTDMDNPNESGQFVGPVITSDMADPAAEFTAQVDQGANGSGSERGLEAAQAALSEPLLSGVNAGFLREDAALAAIIVTDEDDDSTVSSANFATFFNGLKTDPEKVSFSAICGDSGWGCSDAFGSGITASAGTKYLDVADRTGGIFQSICTSDFDVALQHLSLTAAGMSYEFCLSGMPMSAGSIDVEIDNVSMEYDPLTTWDWDSTTNCITFYDENIPGPGASIEVSYVEESTCE